MGGYANIDGAQFDVKPSEGILSELQAAQVTFRLAVETNKPRWHRPKASPVMTC